MQLSNSQLDLLKYQPNQEFNSINKQYFHTSNPTNLTSQHKSNKNHGGTQWRICFSQEGKFMESSGHQLWANENQSMQNTNQILPHFGLIFFGVFDSSLIWGET